ncbi:MAG: hypothetical protein BGO41_08155 [Clostridiales bacterium 38-18]|nr:MAG: hypothetical protein BGO41_08155 [Clostridiales bacterium 38-18]
MTDVQRFATDLKQNIQKVIVGKNTVIDLIITSMLCSGHVLLEDIPGTGKTLLARSLAKSFDVEFNRIQFTPDLLPSDITGLNVFNQGVGKFEFRKGPLMSQIVLADEINRATPRTQSSLLEAMAENQITVDGETYSLSEPFFVIATQNPIESSGTFPLPEAQLDRFFMQLSMGYPTKDETVAILHRFEKVNPIDALQACVDVKSFKAIKDQVKQVRVSDAMTVYIIDLAEATRDHSEIELGVSPRGVMALFNGAKALAAINGRDYVTPEDVKQLIVPIWGHRILIRDIYSKRPERILELIMAAVEVPTETI